MGSIGGDCRSRAVVLCESGACQPRSPRACVHLYDCGFDQCYRHAGAYLHGASPQAGGRPEAQRTIDNSQTVKVIVATEVALAFVLLIGTALLVHTFANILRMDPGFRAENVF